MNRLAKICKINWTEILEQSINYIVGGNNTCMYFFTRFSNVPAQIDRSGGAEGAQKVH